MFETLEKTKQIAILTLARFDDYLQLLRIELKMQGRGLAIQAAGYLIAAFFAMLAIFFIGMAIIVSFWETEYRLAAAWGVVALYLILAGVGLYISSTHRFKGSVVGLISAELKRDVDMVKETL
ncbi:MAG: phage holin family protein [Janthinobacterium lividum]